MKLFLSWSGDDSRRIAETLRLWFPTVLSGLRLWLSNHDIPKGDRWHRALGKELEETSFGVMCVTPENLNSPWMIFEAGAISKYIDDARVAPILFGLTPADVHGPLSQFQLTTYDQADVLRLVESIAGVMMPPPPPLWRSSFSLRWRSLSGQLKPIIRQVQPSSAHELDAEYEEEPLDADDDEVLRLLAEVRDRKNRDWIDVDDVKRALGVSATIAEYHLDKLERFGLIDEDDDVEAWFLSRDGLRYVVEEGLAE